MTVPIVGRILLSPLDRVVSRSCPRRDMAQMGCPAGTSEMSWEDWGHGSVRLLIAFESASLEGRDNWSHDDDNVQAIIGDGSPSLSVPSGPLPSGASGSQTRG